MLERRRPLPRLLTDNTDSGATLQLMPSASVASRRTPHIEASMGAWRRGKAEELLTAAEQTLTLWAGGGLDFGQLAADIAGEVRAVRSIDAEIDLLEGRIGPALHSTTRPGRDCGVGADLGRRAGGQ
jgi:hypothetical protein